MKEFKISKQVKIAFGTLIEKLIVQYSFFRGYQKSIIEMELEEQRKDKGMLWQQTKESILEARGIISSNNSITGELMRERLKNNTNSSKMTNGDYTRVPLNDDKI